MWEDAGVFRDAHVVALLTTYNRSDLLERTLPRTLGQLQRLGIPCMISDDHSSDRDTRLILSEATTQEYGSGGAYHVGPHPLFQMTRPRALAHDDEMHPHFRVGRNFIHGVREIRRIAPNVEYVLKLDDDAWLHKDAVWHLTRSLMEIRADRVWGERFLALSGIMSTSQQPVGKVRRHADWCRTDAACSVMVLHRMDLLHEFFRTMKPAHIAEHGWDSCFFWHFAKQRYPRLCSFTSVPSLAFHTAHTGVHLAEVDMNRRGRFGFAGRRPQGWPFVRRRKAWGRGAKELWREHYGGRQRDLKGRQMQKKGS